MGGRDVGHAPSKHAAEKTADRRSPHPVAASAHAGERELDHADDDVRDARVVRKRVPEVRSGWGDHADAG